MPRLCPCETSPCACNFEDGGQITVSGVGTEQRPYDLDFTGVTLSGSDNGSVDVTVNGTDDFQVLADVVGVNVVTVIQSSGTWVKPVGPTVARIDVIGGGGGGGVPQSWSSTPPAYGGLGGGGGARSCMTIPLALLPDEVPITVGQGGQGGSDPGSFGQAGGFSAFGDYIYADGGGGGPFAIGVEDQLVAADGGRGGTAPEGGPGGNGSFAALVSALGGTIYEVPGDSAIYDAPAGGQAGASADGEDSSVNAGLVQPAVLGSWAGWGGGDTFFGPDDSLAGRVYGGGGGGADAEGTDGSGESVAGDGAPGVVVITTW